MFFIWEKAFSLIAVARFWQMRINIMNVQILSKLTAYSLDVIREEACQLVIKGMISRQQPIYVLCQYIPPREWVHVESELERADYLLRDRIGDLIGTEIWSDD